MVPISASLRPGNRASFEKTVAAVASHCKSVSDLTGARFELQTFRSRNLFELTGHGINSTAVCGLHLSFSKSVYFNKLEG